MRRAALSLFGTLLLAIVLANPAAADCTVTDGDVSLEVCDDDNGNGVPDHVSADSTAGDFSYHESSCAACPAPSGAAASVAVGGVTVQLDLQCAGAPGQSGFDCRILRADAASPVAAGWLQYIMGPAGLVCAKISTASLAYVQCTNAPEP